MVSGRHNIGHDMDTNNRNGLVTFLAVWGAVLSTITVMWTVYKDVHDRSKIKVTAKLRRIGQREVDGQGYAAAPHLNIRGLGDELYVVVSVMNVGRRPMNWKGWGGTYRNPVNGERSFVVSARELPKILGEQDEHSEFTFVEKEIGTGNVEGIQVWDGGGRQWHVSKKDMKQLLADIKQYATPPPDWGPG
jgi:hypothetical protein